jgi:hypothetical protein
MAYARAQRAGRVLVVGSPRTRAGEMLVLDLGTGREETLAIATVLDGPERLLKKRGV